MVLNLFHNERFVFDNDFDFDELRPACEDESLGYVEEEHDRSGCDGRRPVGVAA